MEMARSESKQLMVLKLGTSTLTRGTDSISRGKIEDIARQIKSLDDRYEFIIVSSGAIAAAKQFVYLNGKQPINDKQALASIGQPHLMRIFYEIFNELGLPTAQCLLTYHDFDNEVSKKNITNTIHRLLENGYIPIINENDTVATEEINFGDNDKLAALTAQLLEVDLLVMATNTYGLYDADPNTTERITTIPVVSDLTTISSSIGDTKSSQGSGGMKSKIEAAAIAQQAGIETWLIYGYEENFLLNSLAGEAPFTKIIPTE